MTRHSRHIARDITYASVAKGRSGRAVIKAIENATGRIGLIRKAMGYQDELANGADFWDVMALRYGLSLDVIVGSLSHIPPTGPVVVVANHPYGILDGLMLGHILSARRAGTFKIMANHVFQQAPDLQNAILPVSFAETKDAVRRNLETRSDALAFLGQGGAIGVFPGGTVSTAPGWRRPALDPQWRTFTAKMIARSDAVVVPIFFEGRNSQLFQLASRLNSTLRVGLLIREFKTRVNTPVQVAIGKPIGRDALDQFRQDPTAAMDFLRKATYDLSPSPIDSNQLGYEFEHRYKGRVYGGRDIR
ncbi:Putative hemolysin [Cognatiyoonia koreensis]|uniref:Putative hemolysin n=1 Tax=Cognatiyoonia koreensis TaxID=364200 RepID=A0A1I0PLS3_9RHOB|nr:lysophospholipid acyltransferase family protein [Cognatiyoonia koreensis]SEW15211.1 Putative hemolysin [Cognatiyoonia koreensis]